MSRLPDQGPAENPRGFFYQCELHTFFLTILCYDVVMKGPDPDKERSERRLTVADFLRSYNENLPSEFPRASLLYLGEFRKVYPGMFKGDDAWSLDQHRKKFMDWLPMYLKSLAK